MEKDAELLLHAKCSNGVPSLYAKILFEINIDKIKKTNVLVNFFIVFDVLFVNIKNFLFL